MFECIHQFVRHLPVYVQMQKCNTYSRCRPEDVRRGRMGVPLVHHMLGVLVHAFDWEMPEGATAMDMEEEFGLALQKKVPVRAIVRPRLAPIAYE